MLPLHGCLLMAQRGYPHTKACTVFVKGVAHAMSQTQSSLGSNAQRVLWRPMHGFGFPDRTASNWPAAVQWPTVDPCALHVRQNKLVQRLAIAA